jgi:hypothetical protein
MAYAIQYLQVTKICHQTEDEVLTSKLEAEYFLFFCAQKNFLGNLLTARFLVYYR